MSCNVWKRRSAEWKRGYVLIASELMYEYYDWEEDPMCDCTPAQKFYRHTGKWRIEVFRSYKCTEHGRNYTKACSELGAETGELTEEEFNTLWDKLMKEDTPFIKLKELFLDIKLKNEAIRLMP